MGALSRLEATWKAYGMPLAGWLDEGLPRGEITAMVSSLGILLPPEPQAWWNWHNGCRPRAGSDVMTGRGWSLLKLDEAVRLTETMRDGTPPGRWADSWLCFSVEQRDVLAFDCVDPESPETPVVHYNMETSDTGAVPCLRAVVDWWVEAFETGVYFFDSDGDCLIDFERPVPSAFAGIT